MYNFVKASFHFSEINESYGWSMSHFLENTKLFSRVAIPVYIPNGSIWETQFLFILISIYYCHFFFFFFLSQVNGVGFLILEVDLASETGTGLDQSGAFV